MSHILSLKDLPLKGKKVLMRVDFNVPLTVDGKISDDHRIQMAFPSIQYILEKGGSLILMSHLGRPEGKENAAFSLSPIAKHLSTLLKKEVKMAPDCVGAQVQKMVQTLLPGQILLLENLRFHSAEEDPAKDPSFAKQLASLGDCYVSDAFAAAHRAHSSITEVAKYFPKASAAGFLMEKEISHLSAIIQAPKKPFYAIIGGAKISTKIKVLKRLSDKIDAFFIGGGMAFTFLKAEGRAIGKSIFEPLYLEVGKEFLALCSKKGTPVYLPEDCVIADNFSNEARTKIISCKEGIPDGWIGMDIGQKTLSQWMQILKEGATIFWNGPMGVFELPNFAKGTTILAKKLGNLSCQTIVGGGDSVAAIESLHLEKKFTHISTGGGAALEFIEKGHLPGIDALTNSS